MAERTVVIEIEETYEIRRAPLTDENLLLLGKLGAQTPAELNIKKSAHEERVIDNMDNIERKG
jgi:hypothetical protein